MYKVLSIAGSDCSGGAGIQADIKTIAAHGMYAMTAITALTAQNTTGVYGVLEADKDFVAQQIDQTAFSQRGTSRGNQTGIRTVALPPNRR